MYTTNTITAKANNFIAANTIYAFIKLILFLKT